MRVADLTWHGVVSWRVCFCQWMVMHSLAKYPTVTALTAEAQRRSGLSRQFFTGLQQTGLALALTPVLTSLPVFFGCVLTVEARIPILPHLLPQPTAASSLPSSGAVPSGPAKSKVKSLALPGDADHPEYRGAGAWPSWCR